MSRSGSARAPRARRLPALAAAIACSLGALAAVQATGGGADARTTTCSSGVLASNALGPATGWTEFVETDGTRGSESEGSIAYGGNHSAGGMTVGTRLSGYPSASPALVVVGSHGTYNLQAGSAYVSPKSGVNFNGGGSYLTTNPIDFAAAFTQLRATSTSWGGTAATGTVTAGVTGGNAALVFTGTSSSLNVFNLSTAQAALLAGGTHVGLDVPAGATTIINVPGTSPTIAGQMWVRSGSGWNQVSDDVVKGSFAGLVWNFPDATAVTLSYGSAFGGTILAPRAALTVASVGHTIGQIIARSFSSNFETHLSNFPSTACVPGTPPPPGNSDVTVTKTASTSSPHGGDTLTYTLVAGNVGASDATGVVVTDPLPAGVTFVSASAPCTQSGGTVTCALGTLAAGASRTVTVTVTANPVAGAGPASNPQAYHWLTPYKVESQVDLSPGEQKSVTVACGSGDILSDGDFRVDHVDQDTGAIPDVKILSAQSTGIGTWKGVIRNDATGRAQAKAFIVCLPGQTEAADRQTGYSDSHRHAISADSALATATQALPAGRTSVTVACPSGTVPVAPGYDLSSAAAILVGSESDDVHRAWTFTFEASSPVTATVSARCLHPTTSAVYGHTHDLLFTHVVQTVTVPGNTAKEGDEFQVICPDDAKGVVATFDLPPGVQHFGNDPRLKERAFRLFNDSGTAKTATVDLICLHDRTSTEQMGTVEPVTVVNTASVASTSTDANPGNNSASATISVQPGTATTSVVGDGHRAAAALSLRVVSSMPGRGALTVRSHGAVLATGTVGLRAGGTSTARLHLGAAEARRLAAVDRVTVRLDPSRGKPVIRTVRVRG